MARNRSFSRTERYVATHRSPPHEYSPHRVVWTSDMPIRAVFHFLPVDEDRSREVIWLDLSLMRRRNNFPLYLTILRPDELEVLKAVIDEAFEAAREMCAEQFEEDLKRFHLDGAEATPAMYRPAPRLLRHGDVDPAVISSYVNDSKTI